MQRSVDFADVHGFHNVPGEITTSGLLSLKIAVENYFETFKNTDPNLFFAEPNNETRFYFDYIKNFFETIVHVEHFLEILVKDLLRQINPLLIIKISNSSILLYKLIEGTVVNEEEYEKDNLISFYESIEKIKSFIKQKVEIDESVKECFEVINKWNKSISKLMAYRNGLWHKANFVLTHRSFDLFMGQEILPLINELFATKYLQNKTLWRYQELSCGIDPIDEIIAEIKVNSEKYDFSKICSLKEIGRASYKIPFFSFSFGDRELFEEINSNIKKEKEEETRNIFFNYKNSRIIDCPVCGIKSLVCLPVQCKCQSCSFEPTHEIDVFGYYYEFYKDKWFQ